LFNELTSVRIQIATGGGSENPYQTRAIKRAIARILTIQREEELKPEQ
jgi:ribosomal protein L29